MREGGGVIFELLTSKQMGRVETAAIESKRISAYELMERASSQAAAAIDQYMTNGLRYAEVLCGPGNNGGDGYGVAWHLVQRGWSVRVWTLGDSGRLSRSATQMKKRYEQCDCCIPLEEFSRTFFDDNRIIVDALFGIGLNRPLEGIAASAMAVAMRRGRIAAIDILSGVNSDTGEFRSPTIPRPNSAELTITFESVKPGHLLGAGGHLTGKLITASLGLEPEKSKILRNEQLTRIWTWNTTASSTLKKRPDQHKYHHGHALVVSGPTSKGGAARLAAHAALRVGTGLVSIAAHAGALREHAAQLNSVMLTEANSARDIKRILRDRRINAVCVGPALGTDDKTRSMVLAILESKRKTVLDADALTAFANNPDVLSSHLNRQTVLTPHGGEFSRLFPYESNQMAKGNISAVGAVSAVAKQTGSTVVLKGAATIVASASSNAWILPAIGENAAPWLATAGSGDVLAGLIAGLLARGTEPEDAACIGTYLHACAARAFGPGLIAEDLPDLLPKVLTNLFARSKGDYNNFSRTEIQLNKFVEIH